MYRSTPDFARGAAHVIAKGRDIALIGTGLGTSLCVQAAARLKESGLSPTVVDMVYLKPFDGETLCRLAREGHSLLVVEEHNTTSGLASLVAEALGRNGIAARLEAVGLPDGDLAVAVPQQILNRYGLTVDGVLARARALAKRQ